MPTPDRPCPCRSGRRYRRCCEPFHAGRAAPTPELLMRSRFAAYALGLVDYIVATTDPAGPQWQADRPAWEASIRAFSAGTRFEGLRILDAPTPAAGAPGAGESGATEGFVTFRATLSAGGRDASFTERSRFTRGGPAGEEPRWRYHSGTAE